MPQRDNISFGFMVQRAICDIYNMQLSQRDIDLFHTFHNDEFVDDATNLAREIRRLLPRNVRPQRFVSNNNPDDINNRCINFILSRNKTMSIRIAKNGYVPPRILGQAGLAVCNYYYSSFWGEDVTNLDELKQKYADRDIIKNIIPMLIDRLLWCDYNFFIVDDGRIVLIKKYAEQLNIQAENITYTDSEVYPHIQYYGKTICEIAYVRATPVVRIQIKNLNEFIDRTKVTQNSQRWNYGSATEKAICNIFNLENNINRTNNDLVRRITPYVEYAFRRNNLIPDEYVGNLTSEERIKDKIINKGGDQVLENLISGFGTSLHAPMDFYAQRNTISVKTTKMTGGLICPDTIGQPGEEVCRSIIGRIIGYRPEMNPEIFVDVIMDRHHLKTLIVNYIKYLFSCNYMFYLNGNNNGEPICKFYSRDREGQWASDIQWNEDLFVYAKSIEQVKSELRRNNNSGHGTLQIDYDGYRIGQFDIHQHHRRYLYQFRFSFNKMMDFIADYHHTN